MCNHKFIQKHKIFISKAYGAGEGFPHQIINKPFHGEINSIFVFANVTKTTVTP